MAGLDILGEDPEAEARCHCWQALLLWQSTRAAAPVGFAVAPRQQSWSWSSCPELGAF